MPPAAPAASAAGAAPRAAATPAPSAASSPAQVTGTAASPRLIAPGVVAPQPVAARRDDPIANLIAPQPSPKLTSVQRALSEFGYGQIRPTGVLDESTSTAIQKFEREHKMPITGRVSEHLVAELTAMVGHPLN
jgi:peptidoglycan hydrolase-like protein with peptidoglycan-binding domain